MDKEAITRHLGKSLVICANSTLGIRNMQTKIDHHSNELGLGFNMMGCTPLPDVPPDTSCTTHITLSLILRMVRFYSARLFQKLAFSAFSFLL